MLAHTKLRNNIEDGKLVLAQHNQEVGAKQELVPVIVEEMLAAAADICYYLSENLASHRWDKALF